MVYGILNTLTLSLNLYNVESILLFPYVIYDEIEAQIGLVTFL